jgi:DNA-binding protein YbaB
MRMVKRLETVIRQAMKDGRTEVAEEYLKTLESLVPGYKPDGKEGNQKN